MSEKLPFVLIREHSRFKPHHGLLQHILGKNTTESFPMDHAFWMKRCLRLARNGVGHVSPNPAVGAILVAGGRILATGFHKSFGGPHAEVNCLRDFHGDPRSATLYVNLEPCAHSGKTPPCTDLIIESGIRNVVVGMIDPNPLVSGKGVQRLRMAGIRVTTGVCEDECRELNSSFMKSITTGMPYIHLKVAVSIDGKLGGAKKWISSKAGREQVHRWRATHDAVLVGAGTVIEDDPRLDVRHVKGRDPHVVIIDGNLRVPGRSLVFSQKWGRRIFLCTSTTAARTSHAKVNQLRARGVEVLTFRANDGRIPLRQVCKTLLKSNIGSILVEGGSDISAGFLSAGLVDELSVFIAPFILGGMVDVFRPEGSGVSSLEGRTPRSVSSRGIGSDLLLQYFYN